MSADPDPADAEARVRALMDPDDTLLGLVHAGSSKAADYVLAVVERPHPEEDGQVVLMERYAQLAEEWSEMEDTFLKNGINRRSKAGDGSLAQSLAQVYAAASAQQNAGTVGERDPETRGFDGEA